MRASRTRPSDRVTTESSSASSRPRCGRTLLARKQFPGSTGVAVYSRQTALVTMRNTTTTIAETPTSKKNPRNAAVTQSPPYVFERLHPTTFGNPIAGCVTGNWRAAGRRSRSSRAFAYASCRLEQPVRCARVAIRGPCRGCQSARVRLRSGIESDRLLTRAGIPRTLRIDRLDAAVRRESPSRHHCTTARRTCPPRLLHRRLPGRPRGARSIVSSKRSSPPR